MRDIADWFADLIIPAFVGLTSLVIALAALRTSRDAMKLASDAESSRQRESDRQQVRDEAQSQARLLTQWVDAHSRTGTRFSFHRLSDPEPPETPLQKLRRESVATLSVSHVPGARQILAITEHDLEHAHRTPPEDAYSQYHDMWRARTLDRIRAWGLSPLESAPELETTIMFAQANPEQYARVPLGIGWERVYDLNPAEQELET